MPHLTSTSINGGSKVHGSSFNFNFKFSHIWKWSLSDRNTLFLKFLSVLTHPDKFGTNKSTYGRCWIADFTDRKGYQVRRRIAWVRRILRITCYSIRREGHNCSASFVCAQQTRTGYDSRTDHVLVFKLRSSRLQQWISSQMKVCSSLTIQRRILRLSSLLIHFNIYPTSDQYSTVHALVFRDMLLWVLELCYISYANFSRRQNISIALRCNYFIRFA